VEAGVDDIDIYGDPTQLAVGGPRGRTPIAVLPASPNPFRAETRLSFDLRERQTVQVDVFDVQGRRMALLVNRILDPGHYEVAWDGRDESGRGAASGIYFIRFQAPGGRAEQKIVLAR
jgi:hypothetical protein